MSIDWIDNHVTLPSNDYSRMARVGIEAATDCTRVLRGLFTLHYCTIVAVSATSDTARLSRYRYVPYSGVGSCAWRRRDEEVRKSFTFCN